MIDVTGARVHNMSRQEGRVEFAFTVATAGAAVKTPRRGSLVREKLVRRVGRRHAAHAPARPTAMRRRGDG